MKHEIKDLGKDMIKALVEMEKYQDWVVHFVCLSFPFFTLICISHAIH